ncbi:MAG: hypothetical protein B6227_01735 [Fusobacteriia bacterium 4572_74]|nr:MAG: hypothetical protein B6227_01735 [Fusobacteriia bacterium 4572_74]
MLKKEIKKVDILSLAIGAIIGTGAFILPGTMFLRAGMINSIIAILMGGIIMVGIVFLFLSLAIAKVGVDNLHTATLP